jgi:hypothetical protein
MPAGAAGVPTGLGSEPLKLPQATQSIDSQQTAPPPGSSWPEGEIGTSAANPNCASASGVASTIVLWLTPRATSAREGRGADHGAGGTVGAQQVPGDVVLSCGVHLQLDVAVVVDAG